MNLKPCFAPLLVAAAFLIASGASFADTITTVSVADNFGTGPGDGSIIALGPDGNSNVDAFYQPGSGTRTFAIEFDLSLLPVDHTLVSSAILQLTAPSYVNPSTSIDLNGYAGNGAIELADVQGLNNIELLEAGLLMSNVGSYDVTAFIQSRVAAGSTHAGFMATSLDFGAGHPTVYSREWGVESERPMLMVTTVPEPNACALLLSIAACGLGRRKRNIRRLK